jgi:hypothetical protein
MRVRKAARVNSSAPKALGLARIVNILQPHDEPGGTGVPDGFYSKRRRIRQRNKVTIPAGAPDASSENRGAASTGAQITDLVSWRACRTQTVTGMARNPHARAPNRRTCCTTRPDIPTDQPWVLQFLQASAHSEGRVCVKYGQRKAAVLPRLVEPADRIGAAVNWFSRAA